MAIASPRRFFKIFMGVLTPCLFLVGVFFYPTYTGAQTQLPDFVLQDVTLAGTGTAVIYRNDGAAVSGRAYTVSFQWVDANGVALAPKQTLARNTIASRGHDVLTWNGTMVQGTVIATEQRCYSTGSWFRRSTRCDSVQVPRMVTQSLAAYRAARPRADALLAVILDDGNQIAEGNETNNSAQVGDIPFRAAPPPQPSELAISRATFDDKGLFVAFQNQSSVAIVNQPFNVGIGWLDQNGATIGEKRFVRFKNMASAKVEIIDSRTGITAFFQTGPGADDLSAEPLSAYLVRRPVNASKIQITLDELGTITEMNEANNMALINLPSPDFMLLTPIFTPQVLSFRYVNAGSPLPAQAIPVSFWFEWVDSAGARVGDHLYWHNRPTGAFPPNFPITLTSNGMRVSSSGGELPLDQILQNPPAEAVALKITIDGPNAFRETNEGNNSAVLPKPVRPLPDLVFGSVEVKSGVLRIEVKNTGANPSAPADLLVQWFNADGSPNIGVLLSAATGSKPISPKSSSEITMALSGQSSAERLIANPPKTAARLQLTIDATRRITEISEDNNTASVDYAALAKPLPDLAMTKDLQTLSGGQLMFSYANLNPGAPLTQTLMLSFWFEWVDSTGTRIGDFSWYDRPAASLPSGSTPSIFNSRGIYVYLAKGFTTLESILQNPPEGATSLKVTIDGPDKFRETNEGNNIALFPRPASGKADLVIASAAVKDRTLSITARNAGGADAPATDIAFLWIGGTSTDAVFSTLDPILAGKEATVTIPIDGAGKMSAFLAKPPEGTTQLRVALDGNQKFIELSEENNVAFVERSEFPTPVAEKLPDLAIAAGVRTGGVVKLTLVNETTDVLRAPLFQFKWIDAKGNALETSPVSSWSGTNIAPGKTGEFAIEYERWREDGVTRFLKRPPSGAAALLAILDPENKVKESNEDNNSVRIALGQPDLLLGVIEARDGILRIEVKNGGTAPSSATDIWLMWFGAKGALSSSAAVEISAIAQGASTEVTVPFDGKTEASTILRVPPKEGTRVRVFVDGSKRVEESNEQNNDAFLDRSALAVKEIVLLPDLAVTALMIQPGGSFLVAGVENRGKAEVGEFVWELRWLDASGNRVGQTYKNTHPGLKSDWRFGATSDAEDKIGKPVPMGEFVADPPAGAVFLEYLLDPDDRIREMDESNNKKNIATGLLTALKSKKKAAQPEMSITLSTEIIPAARAAASSPATAGFLLALFAFASGGMLLYTHHGSPGGARGYLGIFPLLFISSRASYMRLRGCGSGGCKGAHFRRHKRLKRMARVSLGVALATVMAKLGLALMFVFAAGSTKSVSAALQSASPGDSVRATLVAKNSGVGNLEGITLRLACPSGAVRLNARLDDREDRRDASQGFAVSDLTSGAAHRLAVVCGVEEGASRTLRFIGDATLKSTGDRRWYSNIVEVAVKPRPEPEPMKPIELSDLTVEGIGFLPLIDIVEAANKPLPAVFSAYVRNRGDVVAGSSMIRVRVDIGANGSWDVTSKFAEAASLAPGAQVFVKIPLTWNAPAGTSIFEICADTEKSVQESDESNNCEQDRFIVAVGEEPYQEEPGLGE
ncbi:MAG: CARDB domain-containing protein [Patescibacteria group bacterium]